MSTLTDTGSHRTARNPADTAVCLFCKHMRRRAFIETLKQQQLTTIEQVCEVTAVNTSCGICYETVIAILDEVNRQENN